MKFVYAVLAAFGVGVGLCVGASVFEYVTGVLYASITMVVSITVVYLSWDFLRKYTTREKVFAFILAIPAVIAAMYVLFEVVGLEKSSKRLGEEVRPLLEEKIQSINEGE